PDHRATLPIGLVPNALLHARNFHWTQMKGAEKEWVLTARDASYSKDKTSVLLKDAKVEMIASDGRSVMLIAPDVALKMKGNHVQEADMSGGITVHYGEFVLTTERAIFVPDTDALSAPGDVTVTGQGIRVTGIGLTGHPHIQQFVLNGQVNTEITRDTKGARSHQK